MRLTHSWIGLLFIPLTACAPQPDAPVMCLFEAGETNLENVDPGSVACASRVDADAGTPLLPPVLVGGEAYYIRHELPPEVEAPGKLHLRIESPCGAAEELDVDYASQVETAGGDTTSATSTATAGSARQSIAFVARVAPVGAECSLVVTASIANSTLVVTTPADMSACKEVVCPSPADAGTDTTTSGAGGGGTGGSGGTSATGGTAGKGGSGG